MNQGPHHHLYNTTRWRKIRAHQLMIEPMCCYCLARGITNPATVADHIKPHRGDADLFWRGELQSLCATCHSAAKQREERDGYSSQVGVDGHPIDPMHPWNK